jgi:nucleotide-binding universal stress UspA family protein
MGDPAFAIDEAAKIFHADMIACATHGRGMLGRLLWGSVARRALVHSPVPVLLRHAEDSEAPVTPERAERRIMVPLDGSPLGEKALPWAQKLATQWQAEIRLVHVVPDQWTMFNAVSPSLTDDRPNPQDEMVTYLRRIAEGLQGKVSARMMSGSVVERLVAAADEWAVTDVVMSSHGRTGLARVILGSVADSLVHRLHCPIVIVPALSVQTAKVSEQIQEREAMAAL